MTADERKEFDKLANTVLYLLQGCAPARPSLTSLLKMLYYADYEHYRKHLSPITGAQYVALQRGPVLNDYKYVFEQLEKQGVVEKFEAPVQGHPDKPKIEYVPKAEPDESLFLESELEVLGDVIERCGRMTGAALSERTHREGPWAFIWNPQEPGRPIPYVAFRWLENLPDEEELVVARKSLRGLEGRIAELNAAR